MMISSSYLLSLTTFIYLGAAVLYIVHWLFRLKPVGYLATITTVAGVITHTAGIGARWIESYKIGYGHAPFSNLYESLVFFAWSTAVVYLFVEFKTKSRIIGAFATPFAALAMAYASFNPNVRDSIEPLIPALQSNWLLIHVITCFMGYAAFAVACGLGIMYLVKDMYSNKETGLLGELPGLKSIDELMHHTIIFGFLWLSIGIITGAIWANQAWGTYWGWDPKETWSLITWLVYAAALHARFVRGWRGKKIAFMSIVGFCSVMFTYFGVNFLLSGLHSYGSQ